MDESRPPSHSLRQPRRSTPALHHLKLAPLSPDYPSEDNSGLYDEADDRKPRTSYIQGKSAPTTPGILSRSPSRTRIAPNSKASRSGYVHESYVPGDSSGSAFPKAKSYSALIPGPHTHHARHNLRGYSSPRNPHSHGHRSAQTSPTDPTDSWVHRAGLALATEARESKGQSWLAHRESSTSLVIADEAFTNEGNNNRHNNRSSRPSFDNEDRFGYRGPSRGGSLPVSARASRRGSRAGSRVELSGMVSGSRTPAAVTAAQDYFQRPAESRLEPDFVDAADNAELKAGSQGEDEEEVIARLTKGTGVGLGGWVDRLIGSTLFRVREDGEESETDEQEGLEENVEEESLRRRRSESERIVAALPALAKSNSQVKETGSSVQKDTGDNDEPSGWQDAAWLLSVASKVIL